MNPFGHVGAMEGTEQVEIPGVVPVAHDGEPVEQRDIVLLRRHELPALELTAVVIASDIRSDATRPPSSQPTPPLAAQSSSIAR